MMWPWKRLETRQSSYTDALIQAIVGENAGSRTTATPTATAAVECASGIIGRAFAAADVAGPDNVTGALSPHCLNVIARSLVRRGEFVGYLDVVDGMLAIYPSSDWDVWGSHSSYTYR